MKGSAFEELISDLERKYFWWEPIGPGQRSQARIIAQGMNFALFPDVRRLEREAGVEYLTDLMLQAESGWISERSWEFWRGRLSLATGRTIPEIPPRRSIYDGAI